MSNQEKPLERVFHGCKIVSRLATEADVKQRDKEDPDHEVAVDGFRHQVYYNANEDAEAGTEPNWQPLHDFELWSMPAAIAAAREFRTKKRNMKKPAAKTEELPTADAVSK